MQADVKRCQTVVSDCRIVIKEKGRSLTIWNENRTKYILTRYDGCVKEDELAADFVLSLPGCGDLIVELKGVSVDHAYKQVKATARFWSDHHLRCGKMAAVIVCTQYPRFPTKMQRVQAEFARVSKGYIHVVTRNQMYLFETCLEKKLTAL